MKARQSNPSGGLPLARVRVVAPSIIAFLAISCSSGGDAEVGVFVEPEPEPAASARATPDAGLLFDWPVPEPSQGSCQPGEYIGAFTCEADGGGSMPSGPYSGPISFTLVLSLDGEFLELTSGLIRGFVGLLEFSSPLEGELDCSTYELHAVAVNGQYLGGTFSGTLDGQLDPPTQWLFGTLAATVSVLPSPCVGQWSAVRQQ